MVDVGYVPMYVLLTTAIFVLPTALSDISESHGREEGHGGDRGRQQRAGDHRAE